jgi:hypothetical protein
MMEKQTKQEKLEQHRRQVLYKSLDSTKKVEKVRGIRI